jgi:hypothetical protein
MEDIAMGAFSVFFTQSPSFLEHQRNMQENKGSNNANSIFGIDKLASDNHIRNHLDGVSPELVSPIFESCISALEETGHLKDYKYFEDCYLIPLDGTWYHSSHSIQCDSCSTLHHKNGEITYYHSAITPVLVKPGSNQVFSLAPEFITPQDGVGKQDCENTAAKRWIQNYGAQWAKKGSIILGDDLYSNDPLGKLILEKGLHFVLVCKPDSHKTLYQWLELLQEGKDRFVITQEKWNGKFKEIWTYAYANKLPIRDSEDALSVNWFQLTISTVEGKILFKNAFITDFTITEHNIKALAETGRARWKIENENNNTLKTQGYNLEHNFGHGKESLSQLFMSFNLIAFLFHTILELCDENYQLLRKKLPSRISFFNDLKTLTRYIFYQSWDNLMDFMLRGLEKRFDATSFGSRSK